MNKQYGFIPDIIGDDHYVLGGFTKIKGEVLQLDGQWDEFLPTREIQAKNGVETMNCTSFGTLNCLEVLIKRKFGIELNFSDRYVGIMASTTPSGNSPHKVIETIRKNSGLILEEDMPFNDDITSWEDYYSPDPPHGSIISTGLNFLEMYDIGHEWVFKRNCTPLKLMNTLRYSPLGVSVQAWTLKGMDPLGDIYIKNGSDNHWCMLYGYKEGQYWKIFDSYDNTHKKLTWNYNFGFAKRYSIKIAEPKGYWFIPKFISNLFK